MKIFSRFIAIFLSALLICANVTVNADVKDPYEGFSARAEDSHNIANSSSTPEYIGGMWYGDWVCYNNIDFGDESPTSASIWVAVPDVYAGRAELRIDSPTGTVIAEFSPITPSGGWTNPIEQKADIKVDVTGVHNLYLLSPQGTGSFYRIKFSKERITRNPYESTKAYEPNSYQYDSSRSSLTLGPDYLGGLWANDWACYKNMDFGEESPISVDLFIGVPAQYAGGVEFRIDSPTGDIIASISSVTPSNWNEAIKHSTTISGEITGVHDLYLMSTSGTASYFSFQFYKSATISAELNQLTFDQDNIEVVFSEAISSEKLNDIEVTMLKDAETTVKVEVGEYDSSRKVLNVKLREYLDFETDYVLTVKGAVTETGNPVKTQSLDFTTKLYDISIENIYFTNENGITIDQIRGNTTINAHAVIKKNTDSAKMAFVIMVISDENGHPVSIASGETNFPLGVTATVNAMGISGTYAAGYKAKVYVWDVTGEAFLPIANDLTTIAY